jgi:hypothetical protein
MESAESGEDTWEKEESEEPAAYITEDDTETETETDEDQHGRYVYDQNHTNNSGLHVN